MITRSDNTYAYDLLTGIGACSSCTHWQIDISPDVVMTDPVLAAAPGHVVAGALAVLFSTAYADHLDDCPGGTTGRIKVDGEWVDRPLGPDGEPVTGVLIGQPHPPDFDHQVRCEA